LSRYAARGFRNRTATFPTKKEADGWAKKVEGELVGMKYDPSLSAGNHTLADLIDRYLEHHNFPTRHEQRRRLMWWHTELGHAKLADLTPALIRSKRDEFRDGHAIRGGKKTKATEQRRKPATVNRLHTTLSACLSWGIDHLGWLEQNPARQIKRLTEDNAETRYLKDHEVKALRTACKAQPWDRLWLMAILGINTGARRGEILGLRWRDIQWEPDHNRAFAYLGVTKNGEPRMLVIVGEAYTELKAFHEKDTDPKVAHLVGDDRLVFPGAYDPTKPYTAHASHWKAAREACGLWAPGDKEKHFKFHHTRHTAASHLIQNGVDLYTVQKVLGHKTSHMTQRYAHLNVKQQIDAVTSVFAKEKKS
jgi:integrase